ncbi:MAG: hypothetical protein OXI41_07195 [Chloroflexota bacterium]|nr:hypothetical protein [Chloroflexota bacterium]MDE2895782.1 hypothetical protein [Chloroflexota bacterium]
MTNFCARAGMLTERNTRVEMTGMKLALLAVLTAVLTASALLAIQPSRRMMADFDATDPEDAQ